MENPPSFETHIHLRPNYDENGNLINIVYGFQVMSTYYQIQYTPEALANVLENSAREVRAYMSGVKPEDIGHHVRYDAPPILNEIVNDQEN